MESNHLLLDVNQASLPLDHGTVSQHVPKDLNPDRLGWNQPCYRYTRDALWIMPSGSRETRTHKRIAPPPVFKTGSSSGRMTSIKRS
jgi:hypothetical protein